MLKTNFKSHVGLALVLSLICLFATQATAQDPQQPGFIGELIDQTELTPEQVEQMRTDGAGWGNIMIATRLAERIAADSEGELTFEEALALVLEARADGNGFGQIAHEHSLKVGEVVEGEDSPNGSSSPRYIADLIEKTELTQEQVDQMRDDGAGWGNIMLATRLAERIAADSVEPDKLTFEEALEAVLDARAEDKGFGEIANENDLKLGHLVGHGNQLAPGPNGHVEQVRVRVKKQNIFGQFLGILGFGRGKKVGKPARIEGVGGPERPNKPEKPERPARPEKIEKLERPPRPEKPEKPEKGPRR